MSENNDDGEDICYGHHNLLPGEWLDTAQRICKTSKHDLDNKPNKELEMKIFIDCEYNGMNGQLLSMALVPIDKQFEPFYQEHVIYEPITEWVSENVIPKLNQFTIGRDLRIPCDRLQFQASLMMYLNQYDSLHLIADWPDDIKYFCDLLITGPGMRIDTPSLTMEIRRDLDCISTNPHHALADAITMRDYYLAKGLE